MTDLAFVVGDDGTIREQPPERPAQPMAPVVRARSSAAVAYDEKRRPQAALLYRELLSAGGAGLSWKECWALSGEVNDGWDVGPIVVWMRSKGVDIDARYDVVAGETRFYLSGVAGRPEVTGVGASGGPSLTSDF